MTSENPNFLLGPEGDDTPYALTYWDEVDPNSLVNRVPESMANNFREAYQKRPDLFGLDEFELWKILKNEKAIPGPRISQIRLSFWKAFDSAVSNGRKLRIMDVAAGQFSSVDIVNAIKVPSNVAWILCTPSKYEIQVEEALYEGLTRMREILGESPISENGRINTQLAGLQLRIVQMMDQRAKGAVPTKNLNINFDASKNSPPGNLGGPGYLEDLENQIAELRMKDKLSKSDIQVGPEYIDGEYISKDPK